MSARTPARLTALLAAALLVPALAACTGNPVEHIVEQATGGNVQLGGDELPDGFPSEVPLYEGDVLYGVAVGDDAGKAYNVTIAVPGADAGEDIQDQLTAAGFTLLAGTDPSAAGGAVYDGQNFGVAVIVADGGDAGWSANYTVTPKTPTTTAP